MGSGLIALVFSQAPLTLRKYVQRVLESDGIIVEMEASPDDDGLVVAELSADFAVLASHAEKIGLKKRPKEGPPRPFQIQDKDSYEPDATGHIFSESERLMLLWQIIHEIRTNENDFEGTEPHQTLMAWLKKNGHLEDYFPLHNAETVDGFLRDVSVTRPWLSDDIIERLHDYFGDRIALYFAFLSTYTTCLVTYSCFGAIMFGLSFMPELKPILSLAVAMFSSWWSTWMLQRWYQKNVRLIFDWRGIILGDRTDELLFEKRLVEDIRLEFIGEMGEDEITGKERPVVSAVRIPASHRLPIDLLRFFGGAIDEMETFTEDCGNRPVLQEDASQRGRFSFIVMGVYFIFAAGVIFSLFAFEDVVKAWAADEDDEFVFYKVFPLDLVFQNIPMVVFIVTMMALNFLFGKLAGKLTYYENHLLKRDHSNSLTGKLTAFQFLNTFGVFLYIAFIRKDAAVLQTRVQNLVVIELIIGNIQETLIPIVLRAFKQQQKVDAAAEKKKNDDLDEKDKNGGGLTVKKYLSMAFVKKLWRQSRKQILPSSKTGVVQTMSVRDQLDLDDAEDNADDDFFEMYKQLGLIALFAVAWPLGSVIATVNNCVEIKSDLLRMVRNSKRPIPSREISIGAWYNAMHFLSMLSYVTNLLIFFHTTSYGRSLLNLGTSESYLLVIFIEQMMLALRSAYVSGTSKIPEEIMQSRAKNEYIRNLA
ncbi:hypothetical protein NDN08_003703 [Rhodosorus marinus]|uniref:Anoctamin transmembrane domain-containing protein n=1 Tax=Rhodosorus marinus TaxID=101924 RepID=A0AAV8V1I6_9RHOD|nr:hypothetical protein NDN08_003703 [Rhodosorus marinus]